MVALCFVPHAALIVQNCSIMAQLSQTFDASLYLSDEVSMIFTLSKTVLLVQAERLLVCKYLHRGAGGPHLFDKDVLQHSFLMTDLELDNMSSLVSDQLKIKLYDVREELLSSPHYERLDLRETSAVYQQINSVVLLYMIQNIKATRSTLWRQLLSSYDLVRSIEELSIAYVLYSLTAESGGGGGPDLTGDLARHLGLALEHLQAAAQYFQYRGLTEEARLIDDVTTFYKSAAFPATAPAPADTRRNVTEVLIAETEKHLEQLTALHKTLWNVLGDSVRSEVWAARRTLVLGVVVLLVVLLASPLLIWLLRHTVDTIQVFTDSIELSTQKLMAEKQKSDLLLSRMLPLPVLRRLRAQRTVPAESFEAVTIYFSDIVGFTNISAKSTPMEIINMLNMLYRMFDDKIMKYNVYKVETIGDAYMVVSGLPQRNGNRHAVEIADMALSLMRGLSGAVVPHCPAEPLRIRAGVNTGPCVAGVVGATMPRYCLFGDTINTASRMESTGEAMKIHISQTTKEVLDEFGDYITEPRGQVDVAGKGMMQTYWLVGKRGEAQPDSPQCLRLQDYDQDVLELLIKST
ncbi:uncharacterized protein LOC121733059 isoform X2 [Aricia agestis]|nr:uncharacterized protein LOC121733059 isoform X2 [Aricia agestis]